MNNCRCGNLWYTIIGIFLGLLGGVISGVLFANGLVPNVVTAAWITFGVGVFALIVTFASQWVGVSSGSGTLCECLCCHVKGLVAGAVGSVFVATLALSTVLVTTSIGFAVLVGIGAFFLIYTLTTLVGLSLCVSGNCCCRIC